MTLLKTTVFVIVVVNVVYVIDVVLNVVMIIMYLVLVNKRPSEAPKSYIYCLLFPFLPSSVPVQYQLIPI